LGGWIKRKTQINRPRKKLREARDWIQKKLNFSSQGEKQTKEKGQQEKITTKKILKGQEKKKRKTTKGEKSWRERERTLMGKNHSRIKVEGEFITGGRNRW